MPRNEQDPAASTQQFRAFASNGETARPSSNTGLIVAVVVVAVIVIAVAALVLAS